MADLQQPSPTKKKLPFKRTVRRKSNEAADDDGLSLFSRSGEFFPSVIEDQQRQARKRTEREKAEKEAKAAKAEQERKERLAREERKAGEDALKEQLAHDKDSARKRRRSSLSDEDDDKKGGIGSDDEDVFGYNPKKLTKSPSIPHTPSSKRESSFLTSTRGSESRRLTRSLSQKADMSAIALDDEDEDPDASKSPSKLSPTKRSGPRKSIKLSPSKRSNKRLSQDVITLDDDSDHKSEPDDSKEKENKEEDPSEYYVKAAKERMRKAKELREAREKGDVDGVDDDPVVQILIHSPMDGIHTLMFRRKLSQQLTIVYKTWIEQQVAKHSPVPRPVLESMFFTWKGYKVYAHTTLQTLGIKPDHEGKLYASWERAQDGYHGRDKVYFEAWTQELYEEDQREKEKKRLRDLGELDDEPQGSAEQEPQEEPEGDAKVRVHFKAKDLPPGKATVRLGTTTAQLIKLYRRIAKIPDDKTVEIHFDGEVLDPETTVEEADINDMDSLEVHIR
ncbi:hypothetical protein AAE478_001071 [Parahypoxylon ruwenzoriense]